MNSIDEKQQAEKQLKQQAEMNAQFAQSNGAAIGGYASPPQEPCRAGILDRVQNDLNRASREARKLEQLHELSLLLQKNPEVARILDLIEMVRG